MEHCPNCNQENRAGAKFCTTCGYKLAVAETESQRADEAPTQTEPEGETLGAWPAAAPSIEAHAAWAPPAETAPPTVEPMVDEPREETTSPWVTGSARTWPAPPNDATAERDDSEPPATAVSQSIDEAEAAEPAGNAAAPLAAKDRVARLLDELRDAIANVEGQPAIDLTPVIADLEVAVTPPGAIDPDQLSELRDALLAARERPRDIDTVLALTSQLDSLVALIFAYDRTIAAIERSLEVLRRA